MNEQHYRELMEVYNSLDCTVWGLLVDETEIEEVSNDSEGVGWNKDNTNYPCMVEAIVAEYLLGTKERTEFVAFMVNELGIPYLFQILDEEEDFVFHIPELYEQLVAAEMVKQ